MTNEDIRSKSARLRRLNSHYLADLFWEREPRFLSKEQLGSYFGWRTLLLLQFQYQFQIVVLGGIVGCAIIILRDMSFALANPEVPDLYHERKTTSIVYIYDVFYFVDVFLMFVYKTLTWPEVDYLYHARPGYMLTIELLTIIPYELVSRPDHFFYHYSRGRYLVRLLRVFYILQLTANISSARAWLTEYLQFSGWLVFLVFLFAFIISLIYAAIEDLHLSKIVFYSVLMLAASRVTNKGFGEVEALRHNIVYYEYRILVFIHIISFVVVSYQVCKCACWLVPKMMNAYTFAHRFADAKRSLADWKKRDVVGLKNYHRMYERTILNYFKMTWHHNRTPQFRFIPRGKVPTIIVKDIALDICWDAFKHSHLFKTSDVPFLRSISVYMERNIYYPGEIIIKKNKMKSCMIYVVTGIIQILSEENSETPVLSLSAGSCIGESTLFVDYASTCTVIANSYTEVYILKRKRIVRISKLYPAIFRKLCQTIMARYNKARIYRKAFQIHKEMCQTDDDVDFLPMLYVMTTVRMFMKPDRIVTREDQKLRHYLKDSVFCADYLDMLVLPDDLQLVADSVFVSKKFPFVFQPTSVFIQLWNFIVGLISCMLVCVYPVAVCTVAGDSFTRHIIVYILVISIIWIIDIYIRISTAVMTKYVFYTKISDIVYYRLSTLGFLADILCIVPVGPILYTINPSMPPHVLLLLEIHKLLKAYRIYSLLKKFTELSTLKMVILNFMKVIVTLFILFYYSACILYLLICETGCTPDFLARLEMYYNISKDDVPNRFIQIYSIASYFISDSTIFPLLEIIPHYLDVVILALQILYCCIYIITQSLVISTEVVDNQGRHEFKEYVTNIGIMLTKVKFPQETKSRVFEFLKNQYYLDEGVSFLYEDATCTIMTKNLHILYNYVMYGKYINDITIFTNSKDNLIMEISRRIRVNTYLAGEIITYPGQVCKYMYFIIHGYCKVIYRNGTEKVITAKDCISAYELCMTIPHINTVIAYTDCKLLSFSSIEFTKILRWHPKLNDEIEVACEEHVSSSGIIQRLLDEEVARQPFSAAQERKSFIIFKFSKTECDNFEYHLGFPRLWVIFKYLLMRVTIIPDGRFLVIWELWRCIFAFTTNTLSAISGLYDEDELWYVLICLDVTAWVDLYIMHHACYYNDLGLLVYHPLSTAKYYWTHRFVVDLSACLPIDYPFRLHHYYIYFRLNRLIQLYRVIMFLRYFEMSLLSRRHMFDFIKYVPLTLLAVHYLSSLILYNTCFTEGFESNKLPSCAAGYLIAKRMVNATYTPINAITANLLLTVTSFAMINTTKIRLQKPEEMIMYSFVVLVGTAFSLWLTSKMVASNFFRNGDLSTYQQEMRDLLNFYSFRKIDKNIKKEMINHFEFMWLKKSGKNVNQIMNRFRPSFKEDVLFSKFGKYLMSTSVFFNAQTSFFKSLIVEMHHKVFLKRAVIYRVNDILDEIYLILNGEVEVLGSDYNKLVVLKEGSLFGNLGKHQYSRQLLTAIAKSNLEVLFMKSKTFHEILNNYSALSNYFNRLTFVNMDYLENEFYITESEKEISIVTKNRRKNVLDLYFKCSPLIKNYQAVKIADNVLIVISCLLGFHYECYQKAILATDYWSLSGLHLLDLLFFIRIYLKLHTVYINAYGIAVFDKRKIIRNYAKERPGLYFDIIASVPIDLISYFFVWSDYFRIIFNCLRANRLLRIYLFVNLLQITQEKLHINVAMIRIFYILTLTSIYIQVMGVFLFYTRIDTIAFDPDLNTKPKFYRNSIFIVMYTTIGAPVNNFRIKFTFRVSLHCVLITTFGRFIITLFVAETCATLEAIYKSRNNYKEFTIGLKEYMISHDVSLPLHKEILEYVNLLWSNYRGVLNPTLFNRTPYYLKEATFNAIFGYHLRKHPLIKKFHIDLIRQMAACMEVIIFFPGNHVVYEGDVDQTMYFVHEGVIDALIEDSLEMETIAVSLESGDSFGLEQGLFPNTSHMYTYKVRRPTVLVTLQRQSWYHLLSFFPASVEILNLYYKNPTNTYDENIKNYLN